MEEQKAREILGETIQPDGGLYNLGHYIAWSAGGSHITLDCQFSADELEAIVWWMKNTPTPKEPAAWGSSHVAHPEYIAEQRRKNQEARDILDGMDPKEPA